MLLVRNTTGLFTILPENVCPYVSTLDCRYSCGLRTNVNDSSPQRDHRDLAAPGTSISHSPPLGTLPTASRLSQADGTYSHGENPADITVCLSSIYVIRHACNTAYSQYCIQSILHTANTACSQYCMQPVLHAANTACVQYCIQSILHTANTACSQYCIQSILRTANTAYSQYCIQSILHTVNTAYSQYCVQSILCTVNTASYPPGLELGRCAFAASPVQPSARPPLEPGSWPSPPSGAAGQCHASLPLHLLLLEGLLDVL